MNDNSAIGRNWKDVRKEIFTPEEIAESDLRVSKYPIGSIRIDGITPSDEFLEFAEKEKRGEITDDDIQRIFNKKHTIIPDDETRYLSSIPETKESIIEGLNAPVSEYIPESEVEW